MAIIDHMSLGVADVPAARDFYVICFPNSGSTVLAKGEGFAVFGRARGVPAAITLRWPRSKRRQWCTCRLRRAQPGSGHERPCRRP